MRMLDQNRNCTVKKVALYLTTEEAEWLKRELEGLLAEPEAPKHSHIYSLDSSGREINCSILTDEKLKNLSRYTQIEQNALKEE